MKNEHSPVDYPRAVEEAFSVSQRFNALLLQAIHPTVWQTPPPEGTGRSIGETFAHIHNVRLMWLRGKKVSAVPPKVEPRTATKAQVSRALEASSVYIRQVLRAAANRPDGKVPGFKGDVVRFLAYLLAHEAHHRGQIAQLARLSRAPVDRRTAFGIWDWGHTARDAASWGR